MSFAFSDANEAKFEALKSRYPKLEALTLPCLWMAQYQQGHISQEALIYIAQRLELTPAQLYGVASFYTMFRLEPVGRYHIEVCKTLSCKLCGKDEILKHLERRYGLKPGQTTADGKFTLSLVECMGACGGAPMMSLNETYHENLTTEKIDTLLKGLE